MKADMAKRMKGPKYMTVPPHTPRKPKIDKVYGKHGSKGKNLTYRKDKHFTKDSSNGSYTKKVSPEYGGYENE